jgi:hypothetical protein
MVTIAIAAIAMFASAALAAEKEAEVSHEGVSSVASGGSAYHATSKYLDATLSLTRPQFIYLSLDSLGRERFRAGAIQRSAVAAASPQTVARHAATSVEYRRPGLDASTPARWTIDFNAEGLTMVPRWSQSDPPEPIVLEFNPKFSRATLLGRFNPDGSVRLPAILHLPDQGTVRITAADRILLPMLDSFEKGSFEGMGANGMSNDWKAWDGTPWGYEGFLTDGYYALMAVLLREGCLKTMPPP